MICYFLLQYLFSSALAHSFQERIGFPCDYSSRHTCITSNLNCAWCNSTELNTSCYEISSCNTQDEKYKTCEFADKKMLETVCTVSQGLYISLLVCGYIVSMIVIYTTVERLLLNENVSVKTINAVKFIVFTLTFVPLVMSFLFYEVIFYFLFISFITSGLCISCCIKNRRVVTVDSERQHLINNNN